MATNVNDNSKTTGILAYFLVGIAMYFADEKMKKDAFVKFHVQQAIVLIIASIIVSVVGSIIPIIGWFIILPLGSLAVFVLWLMGLWSAYQGKQGKIPIISDFASKLSI